MSDFHRITEARTSPETILEHPANLKSIEGRLLAEHRLRSVLGQVKFNFNPLLLRDSAADFVNLVQVISEKYQLEFKVPDRLKHAQMQAAQNPLAPTENEVLITELSSPTGLNFLDGVIEYEDKGEKIRRAVRHANLHSQNLTVVVDGTTREAEYVALRVAGDLMAIAGVSSSADSFRRAIAGVQYKTTTQQDLGTPTMKLFRSEFQEFITSSIEDKFGWKMSMLPVAPAEREKDKEQFLTRCAFQKASFSVSTFDRESGDCTQSELEMSVGDRRFHGSDMITLTSQLSYDDHLIVVDDLLSSLNQN